jgi:hypothetical protein
MVISFVAAGADPAPQPVAIVPLMAALRDRPNA